ncbi:hypothetical protein BDV98DRAFT_566166 [Pterulicium gracile]|uniref:Uncharacterized protein n=1 Tax=Pterulicium gracile TaxID=1884261 RepID=A0A5C3QL26_9AGAR|nr:hypothetical protein BDV98DRAFT_566166 [Pterula gracilis]
MILMAKSARLEPWYAPCPKSALRMLHQWGFGQLSLCGRPLWCFASSSASLSSRPRKYHRRILPPVYRQCL